ncbi:MAG: TetR/AcrR family transcriptional regulator [Actinomycetota bacterium]|nr:TetR/AcrR family transcriptional regulator [Actinomycetota bacterium]
MTVEPGLDRPGRRDELLDAADRIVQRDGPAASMAAIAAEAGITKPILYRHFTDKSGLYAALATRHTDRLLASLQGALGSGRTPRERVERTIDAYLAVIEAEPQVYRFLVHSDEAASARGQVRTFLRRLADLLTRGVAGELGLDPEGVRAAAWAHAVVGMVQAAGDWWVDAGRCPRQELVQQLSDLLWGGYGRSADAVAG